MSRPRSRMRASLRKKQSSTGQLQAKQALKHGLWSVGKRKALAYGLAGAVAIGSGIAALRGVQAFRFAKWKQNTSLTFVLGTHLHQADAVPLGNALEKAKKEGRPFDFIVLENAGIRKGDRREQERIYNKHCSEVKQKFARELAENNITPVVEFLKEKRAFRGSPQEVEWGSAIIAYAAKHGLKVKLGEEYSARELAKSEALRKNFLQLMAESKEDFSTNAILEKAKQAILAEKQYAGFRNSSFARITARSAAELRRDNPEFRGRQLKGIVQAGLGHFGVVEEIQRQGVKNLSVSSIIDVSKDRMARIPQGTIGVASFPAEDLIVDLRAKGLRVSPEQVALAFLTEPIYKGAVSSGNLKQASWIEQQVLKQTPESSARILKQVWQLTGKERVAKIMELMSGVKAVFD